MTTQIHVKGHAENFNIEVGPINPDDKQVELAPIRFGYGIDIYIDRHYGEMTPEATVSVSSSGSKSVEDATLHAEAYTTAVAIAAHINRMIDNSLTLTLVYSAITNIKFLEMHEVELVS